MYTDEQLEKIKRESKETVNVNGVNMTKYQATQEMRKLEARIRTYKDRLNLVDAVGDSKFINKYKDKLSSLRKEYDSVAKQAGLRVRTDRLVGTKTKEVRTLADLRKNHNEITRNYPEKDRNAFRAYSGSDYSTINDYLRGNLYLNPVEREKYDELISIMKRRINENSIPANINLYRSNRSVIDPILNKLPDEYKSVIHKIGNTKETLNVEDLIKLEEAVKNKVANGVIFTDPAFTSTSTGKRAHTISSFGDVEMYIRTTTGTKGLYIEDVSKYKHQLEVLLNTNQSFKINSMKYFIEDNGKVKLKFYMEVVN